MANFGAGDQDVAWTAADATNDHSFVNDGRCLLLVKNTAVGTNTVVVKSVADEHGRVGDVTLVCPANTGISIAGPFNTARFNQVGGVVNVDITVDTTLWFAVERLPEKE
jgi:hypothetical protein